MRSLLNLAVLVLVCLVGIGLWRGWFHFSSPSTEPGGNKVDVNVSVDKSKMKADVQTFEQKAKAEIRQWDSSGTTQPATQTPATK